jgi:hypothetical protein
MKASVFHSLPKEIISHIKEYNKSQFKVLVYMVHCDCKFNEISMENISIEDCLKMTEIGGIYNYNADKKIRINILVKNCIELNKDEPDSAYISIKYNNKSVVVKLHSNKQYLKNKKYWYVIKTITLKYDTQGGNLDWWRTTKNVWKFSPFYYRRAPDCL